MALSHALPSELVDVQPLGLRLAGEKTVALFKSRDLEVIRLVLQAGRSLPPHQVPGEITIHCLEGRMTVDCEGQVATLAAGQLLFLAGGQRHGVSAPEDASALVTIALKPYGT
jgi:quercetin dioxygenase-like cupin family protein